jgi:hypothetical protein
MKITYGQQPETIPDGMLTSIRFPTLTLLNTPTGDMIARIIDGAGFATRDMPLSIMFQERTADGHDGAVLSGALHEVTVDGKNVSGRGYLLANANGKRAALAVKTGAMRGNSVDLADVDGQLEYDETTDRLQIRFTKANVAATTIVATPAFSAAHAVIDDERISRDDEEITASLVGTELVCDAPFEIRLPDSPSDLAASGALVQPSEAFFHPETTHPQKIVVTEEGWVYGHLALWNQCHDGYDRCLTVPYPVDGYASFNKPGVLTDAGMVDTGPIFLVGGHATGEDLERAYGGIENAWADVRVTAGRLGPWISGMVRPGVTDEQLYAARASRISGHWRRGKLKAIVSVNAEGFDVPGVGEMVASFHMGPDGEIEDLVAGFCPDAETEPETAGSSTTTTGVTLFTPWQWSDGNGNTLTFTTTSTSTATFSIPSAEEVDTEQEQADPELVRATLQVLLAAEDEG